MASITTADPTKLESGVVEYSLYIDQIEHELNLLSRLPEMHRQQVELCRRLKVARNCLKAVKGGFEPFTPSSSWYQGVLNAGFRNPLARPSYRLYNGALPGFAVERLIVAKKLRVFDAYTVHSPDSTPFLPIASRSFRLPRIDPVLVGWIGAKLCNVYEGYNHQLELKPASREGQKYGFLIASWDLGKDLLHSPLFA